MTGTKKFSLQMLWSPHQVVNLGPELRRVMLVGKMEQSYLITRYASIEALKIARLLGPSLFFRFWYLVDVSLLTRW